MGIVVDACTAQHIGDRKEQQDRVGLAAHPRRAATLLGVVADGMGGHTGGALAAEQVVHTVRGNFERYSPGMETPHELLVDSLNEAHLMIRTGRMLNEQDPHSTGTAIIVEPGRATWAWCGDSRLYHFRGGVLKSRTRDHSYYEELIRTQKMTPADAAKHTHRNVLVTSLGGDDAPRIETAEITDLQAGDAFLLASDGLWDYFSDQELGSILAGHKAREGSELLINTARHRARGGGDNCSLVIVRLVESA
jgi:serine/threonine protein phosphatase PrpC